MSFHFDPKSHTYWLGNRKMTGVTTVLGVINKPALVGWAANQAADYVLEHFDGENLKQVCQAARKAHVKTKEKRGKEGTDVHAEVEQYINQVMAENKGNACELPDYSEGAHRFIRWATENAVRFLASEKVMYHPKWFVGGTADFVCVIDGKKYVGDIKTQKKIWDRVPFFQMAAYRAMLETMGETDFHGSLIVHLPMEGELEPHYSFDYQTDLEGFLAALKLYRLLNNY